MNNSLTNKNNFLLANIKCNAILFDITPPLSVHSTVNDISQLYGREGGGCLKDHRPTIHIFLYTEIRNYFP